MPSSILPQDHDGQELINAISSASLHFWISWWKIRIFQLTCEYISELIRPVFNGLYVNMNLDHQFPDDITCMLIIRIIQIDIRHWYLMRFRRLLRFSPMMDIDILSPYLYGLIVRISILSYTLRQM